MLATGLKGSEVDYKYVCGQLRPCWAPLDGWGNVFIADIGSAHMLQTWPFSADAFLSAPQFHE
jgi:hypothetical protein